MADESERVYRNMIDIFNEDREMGILSGKKATISWLGIYKVRLLAATYSLFIFINKWGSEEEKISELINIATGVAVSSLHHSDIEYDRDKANEISISFIRSCLRAIKIEFQAGPSMPSKNFYTEGFQKLEEITHDALSESIGKTNYNSKTEERFMGPVESGIISSLRVTTEVFGK